MSKKLGRCNLKIILADITLDGRAHRDLEFRLTRKEALLVATSIQEAVALKHDYVKIISGSVKC